MRRYTTFIAAGALLVLVVGSSEAQRRRDMGQFFGSPDDYYTPPEFNGNPAYDGRFTFARIWYRGYDHWAGREGPGWSHDYPDAEENLTKILRDITNINPFVEEPGKQGMIIGSALVRLDQPELFKYPVSYMSEPGGWHPNDKEIAGLRAYLLKGGFMMFDDFREGWNGSYDWTNLQQQMARAIPGARWIQLTGNEPIFHSFFDVDMKDAVVYPSTSAYGTRPPTYWALYENNDPKQRIMAIANVDNDIGESWQWSGTGFVPIQQGNEIFKLGINYVIYALTH